MKAIYFACIVLLAGCTSAKKLMDKAERKDPAIVAKYARDKYPCIDLLRPDTTIILRDTTVYIECPDNTPPYEVVVIKTDTINKTVRVPVTLPLQVKYITKWYEDSAKLRVAYTALSGCNTIVSKLQAANDKLTKKADRRSKENWIWRAIATVLIGWQVFKIIRKIYFV